MNHKLQIGDTIYVRVCKQSSYTILQSCFNVYLGKLWFEHYLFLIREESVEEKYDEFNYIAPFIKLTMGESQKYFQIKEEVVTKPKKR